MPTTATSPTGSPRSLLDIKQTLLAQSRQVHGKGATFSREDNDAFELLGMLYAQIEREVRRDTPGGRPARPPAGAAAARRAAGPRVLRAPAASGAPVAQRGRRIRRATGWATRMSIRNSCIRCATRSNTSSRTSTTTRRCSRPPTATCRRSLQHLARKAEVTERRHVEAARGKEKLELAKRRAGEVIEAAVRDQRLPKFVRALLNQAWADVLTLTLLRHGEDSEEWQRQLEATRAHRRDHRRQGAARQPTRSSPQQIEGVAGPGRLPHRRSRGDRAPPDHGHRRGRGRSGLAHRAGDEAQGARAPGRRRRGAEAEAAAAQRRTSRPRYEHLRTLPFGTWFEFVTNQQGDARASAPVVVQPDHRQRAVREPARPARRRAVARQPRADDGDRPGAHRHRRQGPPGRSRLARRAQRAAQLRRQQGPATRGGTDA